MFSESHWTHKTLDLQRCSSLGSLSWRCFFFLNWSFFVIFTPITTSYKSLHAFSISGRLVMRAGVDIRMNPCCLWCLWCHSGVEPWTSCEFSTGTHWKTIKLFDLLKTRDNSSQFACNACLWNVRWSQRTCRAPCHSLSQQTPSEGVRVHSLGFLGTVGGWDLGRSLGSGPPV